METVNFLSSDSLGSTPSATTKNKKTGKTMKKLLIILSMLAFVSPAFADSSIFKTVEKDEGINNSGGVIIANPFSQKETKKDEREDEYLQSAWNFDIDLMPYVFPGQVAKRQFRTDSYSIGLTYKFYKSPFHIFGKYTTLKVKGDEVNGHEADWKHEHYIAGGGIHAFTNQGENQIQINFGTGIDSSVIDEDSDDEIKIKDSLFIEGKYLWMWDNISMGAVISILDTETKEGASQKGGFMYIGLTAQVGLSMLD